MVSREEGLHTLQQISDGLAELHSALTRAIEDLEVVDDSEVSSFLETQAWGAKDAYASQLALWRRVLSPNVSARFRSVSVVVCVPAR